MFKREKFRKGGIRCRFEDFLSKGLSIKFKILYIFFSECSEINQTFIPKSLTFLTYLQLSPPPAPFSTKIHPNLSFKGVVGFKGLPEFYPTASTEQARRACSELVRLACIHNLMFHTLCWGEAPQVNQASIFQKLGWLRLDLSDKFKVFKADI